MSPSEPIRIKAPNDDSLQLPEPLAKLSPIMLGGGAALLLIGWALAALAVDGVRYAMHAYLTAFMFCVTLSLGGLFFVLIQHLSRAGWSATVRRVAELMASAMPLMALMFVPILIAVWIGGDTMYAWQGAEFLQLEAAEAKTLYLNPWFFTLRAVFCFGCWVLLARYFCGRSRLQDETGQVEITEKMQFWSGPAVIVFGLTASIAAFDWVMSLAPMWFSTMFGVYIFAGSILSAIASTTVLLYWFQSHGKLKDEVTVEHYHDLAKLTFGFIVFWAYISFSQYLLIWYAYIPEETEWFYFRQAHGWSMVSIMLVLLHWLLPFLALMSRVLRRKPSWVFGWSLYIVALHFLDLFWAIMPEAERSTGPLAGGVGILAVLLCWIGMTGLSLGAVFKMSAGVPLIPARDPRLAESIAFENV